MANYCTAAELRTQIEKTGTAGSGTDAALAVIIEAVSRTIDQYTNRPDGFVALATGTARYYTGHGRPYLLIDECISISLVSVKDSATDTTYTDWAATDWQAASGSPNDPDWNSLPYGMLVILPTGTYAVFTAGEFVTKRGFTPSSDVLRGTPTVKVTAKWGYAATVPAGIKQAAIALSARWYKQGQSAWADTMTSPELGAMIYRKENVDIRMMLGRYVKPAIGMR
jgi:hypothetical protein